MMNQPRAFSSPNLEHSQSSSSSNVERPENLSFEGIAANVKLLLKLIQDHNDASTKYHDDRKPQRVAGMMTILEDVKTRIQKSQSFGRRSNAELRRCNTDLRPNHAPRGDKKISEPITDEKEKLRRQLSASLAARKSLEVMCSSLGKEKAIMASELARKVHELNGMEELNNDLKAQNETLLAKLQFCAAEHKEKTSVSELQENNATMQERNRVLSEQLLKSLDGYRSLKRKYKDAKEESTAMRVTMQEIGKDVAAGLEQIHGFRQRTATGEKQQEDIEEEISALERMFECFSIKISKHTQKKSDCNKPKVLINASKHSVLA